MTPGASLKSGFLESTFLKLVAREVEVQKIEAIGAQFRVVTLAGTDLEHRAWTPGDMVQIALGGWAHRSYTPFAFDAGHGSTDVLAYVHGNGIGSAWAASLEPGQRGGRCFLVGPRSAVDLTALRRPAILFGDETSFGTAAALRATASGLEDVTVIFEVTSGEASRAVLDRLGLGPAMRGSVRLIVREAGDRHLDEVERQVLAAFRANPATHGMLTGKASSIQRLYKAIRRSGISSRQVMNVAYWAPGRKGFSGIQR